MSARSGVRVLVLGSHVRCGRNDNFAGAGQVAPVLGEENALFVPFEGGAFVQRTVARGAS